MINIVSCFKWVIDEAYVRATSSGQIDLESVDYKISDYDRNAIEEAVIIKEKYGGDVTAVTVGSPEASKSIKNALSRGPDRAYFINDTSFADLEPSQTAAILADVIGAQIKYDLIICGEGSSDLYARQIGPRLAHKLGIPCICFVQKLEIKDNQIIAERRVEAGIEIITVPMPALVTVLSDINSPRVPGLKDTLAASKKPVVNIGKQDLSGNYDPKLETRETRAASLKRSCVKFGSEAQDVSGFVQALLKAGAIR
ncbi:MAG: electron transfer flavoprotein subunit beta/FixA family protein [Syntrophomonas sp.]|nr:electron transfer flavoprotein subunit beta/FixA family protein [Syntrophomonas sp.]